MTIKVQIASGQAEEIQKGLIGVQGSPYELESTLPLIERRPVKPQLLTAILAGSTSVDHFLNDTFLYDSKEHGVALPAGKRYDEMGARVTKDKGVQFRWGIPSFGISGNVMAKDWANKRKLGTTNEFMSEADVLTEVNGKIGTSWELFKEQQLMNLINTDTSTVAGGPFPTFNFYTEILTGTRPTTNITFTNAAIDQAEQLRVAKKKLVQELMIAGEAVGEFVAVCGSTFFDAVHELERNEDSARPLKSTYDFDSQEMNSDSIGTQSFKVDNFVGSRSGIRFIEYTAEIGGVKIADNEARLVPVSSSNFIRTGYAPAQDRENANTVAKEMYGWTKSSRTGLVVYEESNYLTAMTNPRLMVKLGMD